jgi:hypothetical protein
MPLSTAQIFTYWANKGKQIAGVQKYYKVGCTTNIPTRKISNRISGDRKGYPDVSILFSMPAINAIETFDFDNL